MTELSWQEVMQAGLVGVMRHVACMRARQRHAHGFEGADGWSVDIEGAAGELAVAKALDRYWPGAGAIGTEDLRGLQVRTTRNANGCLIVHRSDPDDVPFILVTGSMPNFVVRGWLLGRDAKCAEWWSDPTGRARPAFFVPQTALRPIEELRVRA